MTVTEAFASFDVDILYMGNFALKTRKNYKCALNSFVRAVGLDIPVQLITYQSIVVWKQYMAQRGAKTSSVAADMNHLRRVLRYLKQRGHNVIDYREIELPRIKQRVPVWLEVDEVRRFLEVIENPRDRAIFACLFSSGARVSELLQLNRDSIIKGEAEIIGKGDKPGKLSFDDNCLAILNEYLDNRTDHLKPLFVSGQMRRITVSRVEQLAHVYADMAGIDKNVTPHVFRHSFATDLKNNGMDIYDLSRQLRHTQVASTMIYVHADAKKAQNYKQYHSKVPL